MELYTDGACTLNKVNGNYEHGPGGWAFVAIDNDNNIIYEEKGGSPSTTNNEQELMAIYKALSYTKEKEPEDVVIYSDSAYCINIFTQWAAAWEKNGWTRGRKHEPILNLELIKNIYYLLKDVNVTFVKVKGHATNRYNCYVDSLAVAAKREQEGLNDLQNEN